LFFKLAVSTVSYRAITDDYIDRLSDVQAGMI